MEANRLSPAVGSSLMLWPFVVAGTALAATMALAGAAWLGQERLIFQPQRLPPDARLEFGLPFEEVRLEAAGLHLDSVLFERPGASFVVLYFHGNAGSLAGWGHVASELARRTGQSVWILDYPGYGRSEGAITSENQLHEVAQALLAAARQRFGTSRRLLVYGRSIGTGLATPLARDRQVSGLVLETPFASFAEVAAHHMPWAPTLLLRYRFASAEHIRSVKAPILILHGDADEIIPLQHGRRLSAASEGATFVTIPGGRHNDLSAHQDYWSAVLGFLARLR